MKMIPAAIALLLFQCLHGQGGELPNGRSAGSTRHGVHQVAEGPWGNLEYYQTYLICPDSYSRVANLPSSETVWVFPRCSVEETRRLVQGAGFPDDRLSWIDSTSARHADGHTRLFPPTEFIRALSNEERLRLMRLLGRWDENTTYAHPSIINKGNPADWFRRGGASQAAADRAASFCFPFEGFYYFTERNYVLQHCPTDEDKRSFLRSTSMSSTLVLRLRLDESTDAVALANYWSGGHKQKDITPILETVIENEDVEYLDVVHLLPPLPRSLLYTYPTFHMGAGGEFPDCFWTALNFFRYEPNNRFLDEGPVSRHIEAYYDRVEKPLQFGDLVIFYKESDKEAVHGAVHIAGDIYFTKNGRGMCNPWILMPLKEMKLKYLPRGDLRMRHLRRK